ncbi:UDP-N-acetylglucosamine 2-epimerase (hydrolyzing) [Paraphotobacterium marinum]|uniref:UDP-N-acetylglucosamine 2-epimerase (Hydrolyzing) n=1 Tax=Paraphotobacterium marinum TaxID=1755811 RepID=A0A220VD55_9GAMM|nr:UDP-N-acetylglucosamine 2-epimerase [Paraphotobacterium marinum]ASK78112.1 UDP-N-acetylglucosamine 2-epimerase (hydrolyzing) [Paraphotobacterium marinum]
MTKICIITGTRAEYGLLVPLMEKIKRDPELELQLIVTGMHLSSEFGLTFKEIENKFVVNKKIEMLLSSDTPVGISKSIGLATISFSESLDELKPDILVVLGDRFEILGAVTSAMVLRIPVAHLHGGETTEGCIDEAIRHSLTKMSQLHFTSTEVYRKRVIQMGEDPKRVFNVGALGIDNIQNLELLSKNDFEKSIGMKLNKRNILVTYHPVTLEKDTALKDITNLLNVIDKLENTNIIFTGANSDTDGRIINKKIQDYVIKNKNKSVFFMSLGQLRYLSALQYVDCVVGNSSSGLIEVPSFKIGTINIGDRQKGRICGDSIISCENSENSLKSAFDKLYSHKFQKKLLNVENLYGQGGTADKIINTIKTFDLDKLLFKKFYDL